MPILFLMDEDGYYLVPRPKNEYERRRRVDRNGNKWFHRIVVKGHLQKNCPSLTVNPVMLRSWKAEVKRWNEVDVEATGNKLKGLLLVCLSCMLRFKFFVYKERKRLIFIRLIIHLLSPTLIRFCICILKGEGRKGEGCSGTATTVGQLKIVRPWTNRASSGNDELSAWVGNKKYESQRLINTSFSTEKVIVPKLPTTKTMSDA